MTRCQAMLRAFADCRNRLEFDQCRAGARAFARWAGATDVERAALAAAEAEARERLRGYALRLGRDRTDGGEDR